MKRITALVCVMMLSAVLLCGCTRDLTNDARQMASEFMAGGTEIGTEYSGDNNGLFDDVRESEASTEAIEDNTDGISTTESNMEENWDEMVEDGQVEDGDGNIGDLENRDGDQYTDEEAAEYAQDRVSLEEE